MQTEHAVALFDLAGEVHYRHNCTLHASPYYFFYSLSKNFHKSWTKE